MGFLHILNQTECVERSVLKSFVGVPTSLYSDTLKSPWKYP